MVDETRNQMMQNLFGEQSEDEEEEEEVDSEHAAAAADHSDYQSDEGEHEGEDDDAEGEVETEGQGEVEMESEAEAYGMDTEQVQSEGKRAQSSPERDISDQKMESQPNADSEEEGYGQRIVTSRRREVVGSESDESGNHYADNEDEEVDFDQTRKSRLTTEQLDHEVVRDVFGDSDEDEPAEYSGHGEIEDDLHKSIVEEETNYERDLGPEDIVPDEDTHYKSEEDNFDEKLRDKPVGPPLYLEVPLQEAPGQPDKMHVTKVSNIMGIEPKPFDPKTYVEEDVFVTDESGAKKRIRLEDNIVRWRMVKNQDGEVSYESNARFVRWQDGSLQLLIGNEVLDISVHDAHQDQSHLFLRHGKGILQSQGRLLQKMKFMPSSLLSKSHRLLTALVDSRHKKVYKVKNCITEIDPEKEKEAKERVEGQTIRANELLHRKRDKVNRKYSQPVHRGRQLSPGFLEDTLDEDDEADDYYNSRQTSARSRFEEDLEAEARAERRIINAKKPKVLSNVPHKPSMLSARSLKRPLEDSESEREESEYESDGEAEQSPSHAREDDTDHEDEYEEEADEEAAEPIPPSEEDEDEEPGGKKEPGSSTLNREEIDSDDESPTRKTMARRRKAIVFDSDED